MTQGKYSSAIQEYILKIAKIYLESNLVRKNKAKYVCNKRKTIENVELLLSGVPNLVIKDVEKTYLSHICFTSLFAGEKTGLRKSHESETTEQVWSKQDLTLSGGRSGEGYVNQLHTCKSM